MARRGKIGALVTLSRYSASDLTAPARQAFRDKFLIQVDPDKTLEPVERERRAEMARRAHYARLAQRSVRARQRRAGTPISAPEAA